MSFSLQINQPMIVNKLMQNQHLLYLTNSTILLLQNYTNHQTLQKQVETHGIITHLHKLKVEELGLNESEGDGIGYRNVLEKTGLRITIYYLRKGSIIKLHDHPKMLVVSYVLKGKLQAKMYSPVFLSPLYNQETFIMEEHNIRYIDGFRTRNHSLHEFRAIEDTYFLDIIFPDYNEEKQCTFYQVVEQIDKNNCKLKSLKNYDIQFFEI